jgi:hypothetical protein
MNTKKTCADFFTSFWLLRATLGMAFTPLPRTHFYLMHPISKFFETQWILITMTILHFYSQSYWFFNKFLIQIFVRTLFKFSTFSVFIQILFTSCSNFLLLQPQILLFNNQNSINKQTNHNNHNIHKTRKNPNNHKNNYSFSTKKTIRPVIFITCSKSRRIT